MRCDGWEPAFFRPSGEIFREKIRSRVRTNVRENPHETAKAPEPRKKRSARPLLPASASIVESRRTCRTREGNPLARLNVPSANAGMTTPASRASRRSLRPLTRSIALRIHPLETLTTTAPQIRSRSSTTDQKPRALPDLRTHRNPRFPHRLKLLHATTEHLDLHALQHLSTAA